LRFTGAEGINNKFFAATSPEKVSGSFRIGDRVYLQFFRLGCHSCYYCETGLIGARLETEEAPDVHPGLRALNVSIDPDQPHEDY
jgi:hypothetical protein